MPVNPDAVGATSPVCERSWSPTEVMLYALSVGAGSDDPAGPDLRFTTENVGGVDLTVLPTFAVIPGSAVPGMAQQLGSYDKAKLVHAEQSIELHGPLPTSATVEVQSQVTGVYDKGSAAIIETRTTARDVERAQVMFTNTAKVFIRGEGGWGGDRGPATASSVPERTPDAVLSARTRPEQALLYRLNGDRNPLHADPAFAARGGFERPILHGLCTFGITGRLLLRELCADDVGCFEAMSGRFSRPVYPGDELSVAIWELGDGVAAFQTSTPNAGVVLDAGTCRYRS